jgi:hypothetical protein
LLPRDLTPEFEGLDAKPPTAIDAATAACLDQSRYPRETQGTAMLYELRIYDCCPGRLPALLNRFDTITLKIWERHGIKQAGFWTTVIGPNNHRLTYLLQWESLAEREKKWTTFQADPEWIEKRAATEKDAPIVANVSSEILTPTAFSSVK